MIINVNNVAFNNENNFKQVKIYDQKKNKENNEAKMLEDEID